MNWKNNRIRKYFLNKRKIRPTKDDIWLVSYPRSGNTWIRLFLANYIWESPKIHNLHDLQAYIPDIYFEQSGIILKKVAKTSRIIKSHEQFRDDYNRVIYIYRKPFDCAWSYFHFLSDWKGQFGDFENFLEGFLQGGLTYGGWYDHLSNWRKFHHEENVFVCYENLINNPELHFKRIVSFIGIPYEQKRMEKSLLMSSPTNVSEITNDKRFYGKEFTTFVKTPFDVGKKKKEEMRIQYAPMFTELNELYAEMKNENSHQK